MAFTGYKNRVRKFPSPGPFEFTYVGRVERWEDGRRLWSESTGIHRLSRGDAIQDAQALSRVYILQNLTDGVPK